MSNAIDDTLRAIECNGGIVTLYTSTTSTKRTYRCMSIKSSLVRDCIKARKLVRLHAMNEVRYLRHGTSELLTEIYATEETARSIADALKREGYA